MITGYTKQPIYFLLVSLIFFSYIFGDNQIKVKNEIYELNPGEITQYRDSFRYIYFNCQQLNTKQVCSHIYFLQMIGYTEFNICKSHIFDDSFFPANEMTRILQSQEDGNDFIIVARYTVDLNKRFVFIVPSYNCAEWYYRNLESICNQTYPQWRVIYIDDHSSDKTAELVKSFVAKRGLEHKFSITENAERQLALFNIYYAVHSCNDNEIIVLLDGDDWLAHADVLSILNNSYKNTDVWLTYGDYRTTTGFPSYCKEISTKVIKSNTYRQIPWCTSHLRTFYAWLFKKIRKEDFLYKGRFFPVAWDLPIMYPLLEMSGGRFKYMNQVLYIYNIHQFNDFQTTPVEEIVALGNIARNMPRYQPLLPFKEK